MVKLEVGSRIRHKWCAPDEIGVVKDIKGDDRYYIEWSEGSVCECSTDHIDSLIPVIYSSCKAAQVDVQREEYGPIRTKRVIAEGTYGLVRVGEMEDGCVMIAVDHSEPLSPMMADDIRETIHTLSQIAEVLEDA